MESFVALSEQEVGDVMSLTCPFGERGAAEEFWVVGMCQDDEDILWGVPSVSLCQFEVQESGLSGERSVYLSQKK